MEIKPITEMSPGEINGELIARFNLNEWHDFFTDTNGGITLLLREMKKRENWRGFYMWASDHARLLDYNSSGRVFIALNCLFDTTGLLAKATLEFLRRE